MIELVVSAHGLSVHQAMHTVVMTEARERVQVTAGSAHPPTFVVEDAAWGLYDEGIYPPGGRDLEAWLLSVYGQTAGSLLPTRRVNIVDNGAGIAITAPRRGRTDLLVRSVDGGSTERFVWAGPADYNVDGAVNMDDLLRFLEAWDRGRGDFDVDGTNSGLDVALFLSVWQTASRPTCQADVNGDGAVDILDLTSFLDWWSHADARADLDGVSPGVVDAFDLLTYLGMWNSGC